MMYRGALGLAVTSALATSTLLAAPTQAAPKPQAAPIPQASSATCTPVRPMGEGTLASPFIISAQGELQYLHDTQSAWSRHFTQTADIDMQGCTWTTGIASGRVPFTGTYSGQGFAISNLSIDAGSTASRFGIYTGLFNAVGGLDASLRGIHLVDATVNGLVAGGIAGSISGRGEVKASSVTGQVMGRDRAAGLVGQFTSSGVVINSLSTAQVSLGPSGFVGGGLVGDLGSKGRVVNSYATGTVTGPTHARLGPLVARSLGSVEAALWSPQFSGTYPDSAGTERTAAQMRQYATYATRSWRIFQGWSRLQPWSICAGFNGGLPFQSRTIYVDPCPNLAVSTGSVVARSRVAIDPISFTATNFTPTRYEVTAGSLPPGLTLNAATGLVTGTPKGASRQRAVTVTATGAKAEASATFTIKVRSADTKGCTTRGPDITITCTKPGTYTIDTPDGYRLADYTVVGADGAQFQVPTTSEVKGANGAWVSSSLDPVEGQKLFGAYAHGPFGLGASVTEQLPPSTEQPGAYTLTVGSAGTQGVVRRDWMTVAPLGGGAYSAVESLANPDLPVSALVAVAGGGGAGWVPANIRSAGCQFLARVPLFPWNSYLCGVRPAPENAELAAKTTLSAAVLGDALNAAGVPGMVAPLSSNWYENAAGTGGWFAFYNPGGEALTLAGVDYTRDRPGMTYVGPGAVVTTRPFHAIPQDGMVRLHFVPLAGTGGSSSSATADTASCDIATPELGDLVTCDQPGTARVTVPSDAAGAVVTVAGAGGGGGRTPLFAGNAGSPLTGGSGALLSGTVSVNGARSLVATVGAPGAATWYTTDMSKITWYGAGGGASALTDSTGAALMSAGGGGGANGFSAGYEELPFFRTIVGQMLTNQAAGDSLPAPTNATMWQGASTGGGAHGGSQGASWYAGSRVSSVATGNGGSPGGTVNLPAFALPYEDPVAKAGVVTMKFCGVPSAPSITSVTSGTNPTVESVDVVATAPAGNGCAIDGYQFRTSEDGAWVSAPDLRFAVKYLESGQPICVQMRARNAVGWGAPGEFACGFARNVTADVQAGGSASPTTITVAAGTGVATPTTIFVNIGDTFVVENYGTNPNDAYLRPAAAGGATVQVGATVCVGDGNFVAANCFLNRSTDGSVTPGSTTFTVTSRGNVVIYSGANGNRTSNITIS